MTFAIDANITQSFLLQSNQVTFLFRFICLMIVLSLYGELFGTMVSFRFRPKQRARALECRQKGEKKNPANRKEQEL
jgi:hypothetical protein